MYNNTITEAYHEEGICIKSDSFSIFGILTRSNVVKIGENKPLLVLVPAVSGTRIGPQRIFVEIAREAAELGYSSFRMDMNRAGDSIQDYKEIIDNSENLLISWYSIYLDEITCFFSKSPYSFSNYLLLSISLGCEPILRYAIKRSYISVIFLSPTYLDYVSGTSVNKKNLRSYWHKVFKKQTWIKLFHFDLNWKKIVRNVIPEKQTIKKQKSSQLIVNKMIEVYSIYGELDQEFIDSKNHWNKLVDNGVLSSFVFKVVKGSDHNFFGYQFKKDVNSILMGWLSGFEWKN